MAPEQKRKNRRKLRDAVGGEANLLVLATLWEQSRRNTVPFQIEGEETIDRLDIKSLAARSKLSKREVRDTLDDIAESLPGKYDSGLGALSTDN